MVRRLWSRSHSLMMRTRMSLDIATSILRNEAAWAASWESKRSRSSLVTPSTMAATSPPKARWMSSSSIRVSSTASWRRAEATVISSSPNSATILATARGWTM